MKKTVVISILLLVYAVFVAQPGLAESRKLTIVFSGDMRGELENCHCPKEDFGGLPRRAGRKALFAHHTKNMRLAADVDVSVLAPKTRGLSGAQIAYICRRAGVLCVKQGIQNDTAHHDVRVAMKHMLKAIGESSPKLTAQMLSPMREEE